VRVVVTWATLDDVRARWADAPLDDDLLGDMILAAHEQVVEYAPTLDDLAPIPQRYIEAEALQTRALGQAQDRDGDVIGFGDGFAVRVRPLGAEVRSLLRPKRGKPTIG
jgi:hypothetical protein